MWVKYESSENWMKLFRLIDICYAIVCDGQKGMLLAIRRRWPHIWVQRCLVHIHRNIISKISKHPETEAGEYMLSLVNWLLDIRTEREANLWIQSFNIIYEKYRSFIDEWHVDRDANGKIVKRWRKHKKLRSAYRELDNEIHNQTLFVYLINPNVPKTTNDVEGGINKQIRKLLGDHCGLTFKKQKKLVEVYLNKRAKKNC
jgi:transposase-like protein